MCFAFRSFVIAFLASCKQIRGIVPQQEPHKPGCTNTWCFSQDRPSHQFYFVGRTDLAWVKGLLHMHHIHLKGGTNTSIAHGRCAVNRDFLGSKISQGERDIRGTYSFFPDTFQSNSKTCNKASSEIPDPNSYLASLCSPLFCSVLQTMALAFNFFLECIECITRKHRLGTKLIQSFELTQCKKVYRKITLL